MTLKDLQNIWRGQEIAHITVLAYYKKSKKYYSFATLVDPEDHNTFRTMDLGDIGKLEVKSVYVDEYAFVWGCIRIDVIEWIDEET